MAAVKDVLTASRERMEARLKELKPLVDEYARLEAAITALDGIAPMSTGNGSSTAKQATARVKAARKAPAKGRLGRPKGSGKRGDQAVEIVTANPGIEIPAIAEQMGIKQNYLYRVLPQLATEGKVVKEGRGWFPVTAADDARLADEAPESVPF